MDKFIIKTARAFFAVAIAGLGVQQFVYADFRPVIMPDWPAWIHGNAIWAYIVGAALIVAAVLMIFGKRGRMISLLLGLFFLILFIGFHIYYLLFVSAYSPVHLAAWSNALKELAFSGSAFIVAGSFPDQQPNAWNKTYLASLLEKFIPIGRIFLSIMLVVFGIDHFIYTAFVADLVPAWIPGHVFWTYFAAIALIGSGVAITLKIKLKTIAILLGIMLFIWLIILHIPRAIIAPAIDNGNEMTSVLEALGFSGVAFIIAFGYYYQGKRIK